MGLTGVPHDQRARYIGQFLEGNPRLSYRQAPDKVREDPEALFELLRSEHWDEWQYEMDADMAMTLTQGPDQTVSEYYDALTKLFNKTGIVEEAIKKSRFKGSLRPEIVAAMGCGGYETLKAT